MVGVSNNPRIFLEKVTRLKKFEKSHTHIFTFPYNLHQKLKCVRNTHTDFTGWGGAACTILKKYNVKLDLQYTHIFTYRQYFLTPGRSPARSLESDMKTKMCLLFSPDRWTFECYFNSNYNLNCEQLTHQVRIVQCTLMETCSSTLQITNPQKCTFLSDKHDSLT